jgi:hypothetical protein
MAPRHGGDDALLITAVCLSCDMWLGVVMIIGITQEN